MKLSLKAKQSFYLAIIFVPYGFLFYYELTVGSITRTLMGIMEGLKVIIEETLPSGLKYLFVIRRFIIMENLLY